VREIPADAVATRTSSSLDSLPPGAVFGTGSLRRRAQLAALRPDLDVRGSRGNVDTRLAKLDGGQYDAIVLAAAGLKRLGLENRIAELLAPPRMLPAPGQGALGIECRVDDNRVLDLLVKLNDPLTWAAVDAERAMLADLHGGCSAPVAAWGRVEGHRLLLDGLVADLEGRQVLRCHVSGSVDASSALGESAAEELISQGAEQIIQAAREAQ
jgi:hydroxymethylbilane synthase